MAQRSMISVIFIDIHRCKFARIRVVYYNRNVKTNRFLMDLKIAYFEYTSSCIYKMNIRQKADDC